MPITKNNPLPRLDNIKKQLGNLKAKHLAKSKGAIKRKPRKFSVIDILVSFWLLELQNQFSFDHWASQISILVNKTISGQAVFKRINTNYIDFLKALLDKSFSQKFKLFLDSSLYKSFNNVFIQDATHFALPGSLFTLFPSSYSKHGNKATAKIQATFNLKNGCFSNFTLNSFRDTDASDTFTVDKLVKKGGGLIRDLGYFNISSFVEIVKKKADFLSRLKYGVSIFEENLVKKLDILKYLNKYTKVDKVVTIGKKNKITCRIVALPLNEKNANERRRKAKNDRNVKTSHSKEYYELLGYVIYVTSVDKEVWSEKQVCQAYRSRWYIEILFKSWKSGIQLKNSIPSRYINKQRAEFFFYASLILVNHIIMPTFIRLSIQMGVKKRFISIIKVCTFIKQQLYLMIKSKSINEIIDNAAYYCMYEIRLKRNNILENIVNLST